MRSKITEVFLDAASNTQLDAEVLKAMKPYLKESFVGNSFSIHDYGIKAAQAVAEARNKIASCIGVQNDDVIFTSGATEGNNMIIKGLAYRELAKKKPRVKKGEEPKPFIRKKHIICGATEHDSVIKPCQQLEKIGFTVTYIKPDENGIVRADKVVKEIREDTLLICLMAVNNELGVENEVSEVSRVAKDRGVATLVDYTQALSEGGKTMHMHLLYPNVDFFTFSAHKIYGPTGVGCVIAPRGSISKLKDCGLITGGAQEQGLRGGTTNTAGVVGMAKAVELMTVADYKPLFEELYQYLQEQLLENLQGQYSFNSKPTHKNIVSLCLYPYISEDSASSWLAIYGVGVSAGSACDSDHDETAGNFNPSHVLKAINLNERTIRNTVRLSFSKFTTKKDIDYFIKVLVKESEGRRNG